MAEEESPLGVPLDVDISAMDLNILEKTMLQIYRNYTNAFEKHNRKLFSSEIDSEQYSLDDLKRVILLLEKEETRAVPIIFCSYADELLLKMYKRELPDGIPGGKQSLFGAYGPFSNFASRIKLAYCFQMIAPDLLIYIDIMRQIRNNIAHTWDASSLADYFSQDRVVEMIMETNVIEQSLKDYEVYKNELISFNKLRLRLIWISARAAYESRYYYRTLKKGLNPLKTLYTESPPKLLGNITWIALESSKRLATSQADGPATMS